jgi:group I intron endonuclease
MSTTKTSGVYSITNTKNKKRYIGSAVNIERRWMTHRAYLRGGVHHSRHLQNAWNHYGEKAFSFEILTTCEPDDLITQEQFWIDAFQAADSRYGYNTAPIAGSSRGRKASAETRSKLIENLRERWAQPGAREKMAEKMKEVHKRPEHKKKVSESQRKRWTTPERRAKALASMKEKANRPEERARSSATAKKYWAIPEFRERTVVAMKEAQKRPGVREKVASAAARYWAQPGTREEFGERSRGEKNVNAKLTEDAVCDIRKRLAAGESLRTIADVYGVAPTNISAIKDGLTWKHVK